MFNDTTGWLLLLVDVSLKATLLAVIAAAGLVLFRVTNLHVRHRVWTAVLLGMLAMPVVVNVVPGLSIPVPGLAWLSDVTAPTAKVELAKMPTESNTPAIAGEPIMIQGFSTPGGEAPLFQATRQPMYSPASEMSLRTLATKDADADASAVVKAELSDNEAGSVPWRDIVSTFIAGLVATYAGIALILITRLFLGVLRATFLIRASSPVTESSCLALAARDGVLCESKLIRVPITVGMLRPCVLLPIGWRDWSQDKLHVVLQHELMHIARGDYAVNLMAEFNRCIYWFHPLAWCLIRWLSDLAERNCDDAVIASTGDRTSYARHLLEIAATVVEPTRVAIQPGISMARSADVESRIDAILDMDRPLSKRMGWKSTALLVSAMLPAFWLAAAIRAETAKEPDVEVSDIKAHVETENDNEPAKKEATSSVAKVSGRVVDAQGQSVANASISLVLYSHEPDRDRKPVPATTVWDTAKSDTEGGFSLEYPEVFDPEYYTKRAYRLVAIAQKEGHGLGWKYVEFSDSQTAAEIKLPQEQVRRGRLVGLEGQPIAGATVHVVGVGTPAPKWLEFRKWPFHDGMPVDERIDTTIPVDDNDHLWPNLIRFRLPPFAVRPWPKSVSSDDKGLFEIRGVTAQQLVEIQIYGTDQGGSVEHSLGAGDGLAEPVTFVLDEPRTITGVVTDKLTGAPIAGAKVRVDSAGAIMVVARIPVVADWKGRQGHLGNLYALQGDRTVFLMPAAFTTTDDKGRYQISAFRNKNGFQNDWPFAITVSSPDDASYLPSKKTIPWPRKTAFKQEADLQLTPGVRVTARIISADGQPAPRARIDLWSRELLYPYEQIESSEGIPGLSPDGVQHPHWRKADGEGRFEMMVPRGESYLFVNQGSDETVVDRVDATQVGLPDHEVLIPSPVSLVLPPRTSVQPHRFYPDRAVRLNYAADKVSDELTIQLHQRAPTLTVEVVLPDGTPANDVIYMGGQAPFRYNALKLKRLMQKIGVNKFSIACCDAQGKSPVSVAFLAPGSGLGLHTEIAAQDIGDKVLTLTLQPLGQARARFIDKDNKPLNAFRPLMWMSVPRKPFSTAADLEQQTVSSDSRFLPLQQPFDSIWTGLLHEHTHGSLRTDAEGNGVFPALIPGATYRISQFGGRTRDFAVQPGETIDLGDVMVFEPERTKSLPQAERRDVGLTDAQIDRPKTGAAAESKATPAQPARLVSVETLVDEKLASPSFTMLTPDGRNAYVASWRSSTIAVITRDPESSKPKLLTTVTDVDHLNGVTRFALHPHAQVLAATSFRSRTVTLFDVAQSNRMSVIDQVKGGTADEEMLNWLKPCVWSPDGHYLYVGDAFYSNAPGQENGRVIVYQFDNQKLRRVQLLPGEDRNLANLTELSCHPDGHTMFATCAGAGTFVVFNRDPKNGKIAFRQVVRNGGTTTGLDGVVKHRFSPDYKFVYTISGRWNGAQSVCVFKFSSDGQLHFVQKILAGQNGLPDFSGGHSIVLSHDGLSVYASFAESNHLLGFARNPATGQLTFVETITDTTPIKVPRGVAGLAITPDDKYLYVASEYGQAVSILARR